MNDLQLLPKWIMKRYLVLWGKFKVREFSFEEALHELQALKKPDDKRIVGLFLSNLRKAGWLEVSFDPEDTRRRIYKLKPYEIAFKEIVSFSLNEKS